MSNITLLPGNGVHNRDWIEQVQSSIGGNILYYEHWSSGASTMNIDVETERLAEVASGKPIRVFAKSAGAILAMKAVRGASVELEKAVFVGTAVNWGIKLGLPIRAWLEEWKVPTLFIQKEHDRAFFAGELSTLLSGRYELLVLPGEDHDYLEFDQYIPRVQATLIQDSLSDGKTVY